MKDWFTVLVPTIYDETVEFEQEKLRRLADESGVDALTLKNAFIGKGIAFLLKTPDYSKVEKLTAALKSFKVPCLPCAFSDVMNTTETIPVKKLYPTTEGMKVYDYDNKVYEVKNKIVAVPPISTYENVSIKKAVLNCNQIALISDNKVFYIDFSKTAIFAEDGKLGVSRKANFLHIAEKLEEKDKLQVDLTFYFQGGFLRKDISMLGRFIAYAVKNGFYGEKLPESLYHKKSVQAKPVFDHMVIVNPFKASIYRLKTGLKDNPVFPSPFFLIAALVFVIAGLRLNLSLLVLMGTAMVFAVLTFKLFKIWKLMHLIEDIPTSKLRSVAAGFVEVKGRIYSPKPVISPISGSPCVFFRYRKEKFVRSGKNSGWRVVEVGEGMADLCVLKDETGEIGVNIKNASFFLTTKYKTNSTFYDMQYGLFGSDNVRYIEEYILDGQTVYVLGTAKPVSKSISYGKFLSEVKKNKEKMKDFDLNNDGVIDFEEWQKAQGKLRNEFLEYKQLKGQGADLVIDKDSNNKVLIVSNEKETGLLRRLKIALPLYFFGSLFFLVLTLWLTVKFF